MSVIRDLDGDLVLGYLDGPDAVAAGDVTGTEEKLGGLRQRLWAGSPKPSAEGGRLLFRAWGSNAAWPPPGFGPSGLHF